MKPFSPVQARIAHNSKRDDDIAQIAYLTITLDKLQKRINTEESNFSARMVEQREVYNDEKLRLQNEIKQLEAKISAGERRLVELLIPIDGLKDRAKETLATSQMQALSIMTREENISELEELLTEKLDMVTEREVNIAEQELKLESKSRGIQEEAKMISATHERLNKEIEAFKSEEAIKTKLLEERENALLIKEKRNHEYLDSRTAHLDEQERGLKDRRAALDRAFEELRRLSTKK